MQAAQAAGLVEEAAGFVPMSGMGFGAGPGTATSGQMDVGGDAPAGDKVEVGPMITQAEV